MGARCSTCLTPTSQFNPNRGLCGGDRVETLVLSRQHPPPNNNQGPDYDYEPGFDVAENEDNPGLPSLSNLVPKSQISHGLKKFRTNDTDKKSQVDTSDYYLHHKSISFNVFMNSEFRKQISSRKYINPKYGTDWDLHNVKLSHMLYNSKMEFIWEGENKLLNKTCTLKITLVESTHMKARDVAKVEHVLRQWCGMECNNVAEIYSYGIYECEISNQPCLVIVMCQEPLGRRLEDLHRYKISKKEKWMEAEIMWILFQIFQALVISKEHNLIHGNLKLDNIILHQDLGKIMLTDFDLKLPKVDTLVPKKRVSSIPAKSIFMKMKTEKEESIVINQVTLDHNDTKCLSIIITKLMSGDDNFEVNSKSTQENEDSIKNYFYVNEVLKKLAESRPIDEVASYISQMLENFVPEETFAWASNIVKKPIKCQPVELLLHKIEVYRWINHAAAVIEEFLEAVKAYRGKEGVIDSNFQQYIKCGNRIIKQYIELNDFLQARDLAHDLNMKFKNDEGLKKALRNDPEEYINFTFLMGNIEEGLQEHDKAIEIYAKGLKHAVAKNFRTQEYQNTLKRIVSLLLDKNREEEAMEYLKHLIDSSDKLKRTGAAGADAYIVMGDIMTKQDKAKQGIKMYLKALELLQQGAGREDAKLKIYEKLAHAYAKANEEEKSLQYEIEALVLKKKVNNKYSPEFRRSVKKVAEMCIKAKRYPEALKHYETYFLLVRTDGDFKSPEYMDALKSVANMYLANASYERALNFYIEYSEAVKLTFGEDSKNYLRAQDYTAQALFGKQMLKQCLDLQLRNLQKKVQVYKENDYNIVIAWNNIGNTCFMLDRFSQATEYHLKCLKALEGNTDHLSLKAREQMLLSIAADYKRAGNYGKGLQYMSLSFEEQAREAAADPENMVDAYETLAAQQIVRLNFDIVSRETSVESSD